MTFDNQRAPIGATHYNAAKGASKRMHPWMKLDEDSGQWHFFDGLFWHPMAVTFPDVGDDPVPLQCAPAQWDGEGLPPVGAVCEFRAAFDKWHRVEVVTHLENDNGSVSAVFKYLDRKGWRACAFPGEFRPILTDDQIAAKERINSIDDMINASAHGVRVCDARTICTYLYDAGYRKQEAAS